MKRRFLVVYDYGQGGRWALVDAEGPEAITDRFPEVQVVDERPKWMTDQAFERLEGKVIDLDAPSDLLADILKSRELTLWDATDATATGAADLGGSGAPDFIVHPNGTTIAVPDGATGPIPANNGLGIQFTDGAGGNGLSSSVSGVRIMDPNELNPNGYYS